MKIGREYYIKLLSEDNLIPDLKRLNHELLIGAKRIAYFTNSLNKLTKVPYGNS